MDFIAANIQKYADGHTSEESQLLKSIERDTNLNVLLPRMLSGQAQGRILSMFSHMIRPNCILEIGTYTGYSALCMAEGLPDNGKIITIDINEELESRTQGFFNQSEFADQIDYRIGNAIDVIPTLDETFDLIFIDADKYNYLNYFNLVIDKVSKGGIIIADNVLWSGKVAEPVEQGDKDTPGLIAFNKAIQNDVRVENVLFPLRDGLMVIRKL